MRVSFLSISITCCYYLLVFCFPAAMWNSVGISSRVAMWSLVDVCFDNSRFWYSVSEAKRIPEARVVDDRDFVYIVRFAGRDKSSVRDSRDWLVVLRWRVGKVAAGGRVTRRGVVQYAGIGGWAGWCALVRDAEPSGRVPKFSEGHVLLWRSIPQCFIRPTPHLVQKVRFCFLLLRSLLGRPRGQGLVCFHTPCPGFFKLRWCDAVGVMYWDIRDTNNMGCAQRAAPAPTPS